MAASSSFPTRSSDRARCAATQISTAFRTSPTIGRYFDDELVINAGCGLCAECDPAKADRREYQTRLNERRGIGG
jgi:hypothetical protein